MALHLALPLHLVVALKHWVCSLKKKALNVKQALRVGTTRRHFKQPLKLKAYGLKILMVMRFLTKSNKKQSTPLKPN
jgi:hypothetical protein